MKKIKKPNVVYGYFDDVPDKEILNTGSESKVQHHFQDECDMKVILERFLKTGEMSHISTKEAQFLDTTNATSYDKSLQLVLDAQDLFASLPSKVRSRFENDPSKLLAFMDDPANLEEAYELGLAQRELNEEPPKMVGDPIKENVAVSPQGEQGGDNQASVA